MMSFWLFAISASNYSFLDSNTSITANNGMICTLSIVKYDRCRLIDTLRYCARTVLEDMLVGWNCKKATDV